MTHAVETYKIQDEVEYRVLVVRITSPLQVLGCGPGSIHEALRTEGLDTSVGLYFYRFQNLPTPQAFSKIGEVSREEGVIVRKQRGWLAPSTYGDSYLKSSRSGIRKVIHSDVLNVTEKNPMYFTFYEFDVEASFPKIDEILAFKKHLDYFGRSTRNKESVNTFSRLGRKLVWYEKSFSEVLNMSLPSGLTYSSTTMLSVVTSPC
jgi:hypothetical protein